MEDSEGSYGFPKASGTSVLPLSKRDYKRLLSTNVRHDSYFDVKAFLNCGPEFGVDHLTPGALVKRNPKTLRIQLPHPIGKPNQYEYDFCDELVQKKLAYINKYNHYVRLHRKKRLEADVEKMLIPKYLLNLLDGKLKDPDCYLKTNYNFYYTGGNLDKIELGDEMYLIQAFEGNNLGFFSISDSTIATSVQLADVIHGITTYKLQDSNLLMIRQNKVLSLYKVNDYSEAVTIDRVWSLTSKTTSYIDCKLNRFDTSMILTLKADAKSSLHNLECNKATAVKLEADCFQFDFISPQSIFAISPKCMLISDVRSNSDRTVKEMTRNHLKCDYMSTFALSENNDNHVYVLTTHHIKKVDLRTLSTITCVSHLLSQPPLICKCFQLNGTDRIFASGTNYNERFLYSDDYVAQNVPNLMDTYSESCLMNGPILEKGIKEHLRLSTTGLTVVNSRNDGCQLYSSNSIGDLFCNDVVSETIGNEGSCNLLWNWMRNINDRVERPLTVTDIRPMHTMKHMLTHSMKELQLNKYIEENQKLKEFLKLEVVDSNLNLKDIWYENDDDDEEMNPNEKVQNWLDHVIKPGVFDDDVI